MDRWTYLRLFSWYDAVSSGWLYRGCNTEWSRGQFKGQEVSSWHFKSINIFKTNFIQSVPWALLTLNAVTLKLNVNYEQSAGVTIHVRGGLDDGMFLYHTLIVPGGSQGALPFTHSLADQFTPIPVHIQKSIKPFCNYYTKQLFHLNQMLSTPQSGDCIHKHIYI